MRRGKLSGAYGLPFAAGVEQIFIVLTCIAMGRSYGWRRGLRYAAGVAIAYAIQQQTVLRLIRKTGVRGLSPVDRLTLSRATAGGVLAGLAFSGIRDREGAAGRLGWLMSVWGMISDVLDGKLARRLGTSTLGNTLDIESDSWLTLWCALGAVAWGGLPRWSLLPPLVRYIHPMLDLRRGQLPVGGGPKWGRLTGIAQYLFFSFALAPVAGRTRDRIARFASPLISGAQLLSMLMLFFQARTGSEGKGPSEGGVNLHHEQGARF